MASQGPFRLASHSADAYRSALNRHLIHLVQDKATVGKAQRRLDITLRRPNVRVDVRAAE